MIGTAAGVDAPRGAPLHLLLLHHALADHPGSQSNSTKAGPIVLAVRRGRWREVEDLQSVVRGGLRISSRQIPRKREGDGLVACQRTPGAATFVVSGLNQSSAGFERRKSVVVPCLLYS